MTLIGRMLPAYEAEFLSSVRQLDLQPRVNISPPIDEPRQVMRRLARFDVGLTVDSNGCLNRSLTICNKLFMCLQAGLAVAATDTPGQREILAAVPGAGFLYPPGDVDSLASLLLAYVRDSSKLRSAQDAAWQAGQTRYNWECREGCLPQGLRRRLRAKTHAFA